MENYLIQQFCFLSSNSKILFPPSIVFRYWPKVCYLKWNPYCSFQFSEIWKIRFRLIKAGYFRSNLVYNLSSWAHKRSASTVRQSQCITPSKLHQTFNNAFSEKRVSFTIGFSVCPEFSHWRCLSRLLKQADYSLKVKQSWRFLAIFNTLFSFIFKNVNRTPCI